MPGEDPDYVLNQVRGYVSEVVLPSGIGNPGNLCLVREPVICPWSCGLRAAPPSRATASARHTSEPSWNQPVGFSENHGDERGYLGFHSASE